MDNSFFVLLNAALLFPNLLLLVSVLRKPEKTFYAKMYILFSLLLFGWQVCEVAFFATDSRRLARYLFDLKLIFVGFLAVVQFFMMLGFYRLVRRVPRWLPYALCAIPAVTALLALTSPWHPLLRESFEFLQMEPLKTYINVRGPWFYVHAVFSQGLVLAMFFIVLIQNRKLPKAYRRAPSIMVCGIALYALGTIVSTFFLSKGSPLDMTLIALSATTLFFYLATFSAGRTDYLFPDHQALFDSIQEAVFILNETGGILEANRNAVSWLDLVQAPADADSFGAVYEAITARPGARRSTEPGGKEFLHILNSSYPLVFEVSRNAIIEKNGSRTGEYVIIRNVTHNRLLIERLKETAGVDELTGLPNRYQYQKLLRRLDTPENLPLSIVIGDVNHLKMVNDTLGHSQGDKLLKRVAQTLLACCPDGGHAARIGGDEFVLLLPGHSQPEAAQVMQRIHLVLSAVKGFSIPPSIALGCATKNSDKENINVLIARADRRMYSNKK